jgi:hypothetical protein
LLSGSPTPIKSENELQQITGDIEKSNQMGWMLDTGHWLPVSGFLLPYVVNA